MEVENDMNTVRTKTKYKLGLALSGGGAQGICPLRCDKSHERIRNQT